MKPMARLSEVLRVLGDVEVVKVNSNGREVTIVVKQQDSMRCEHDLFYARSNCPMCNTEAKWEPVALAWEQPMDKKLTKMRKKAAKRA